MTRLPVLLTLVVFFLLIDWYVFQALRTVTQSAGFGVQRAVRMGFWSLTVLSLGILLLTFLVGSDFWGRYRLARTFLWSFLFINYLSKFVMLPFLLLDDLGRLVRWVGSWFTKPDSSGAAVDSKPISRSDFLMKTALVAGAIPAVSFTWGIISGAHDYRIRRVKLPLRNLPRSFNGLRIAQISDIHSGSFFNKTAVRGGVDLLLGEKPDVVFFTGDLVNNRASEVQNYLDVFNKVKAPLGVYSILGNHDYGDYATWPTAAAKRQNLLDLHRAHRLLGWDLLLDEHRFLEQSGDRIALIGIQNWGTGFAQYGDLAKAHRGTGDVPVKLLLSHDPSHWNAQVRPGYPDITAQFAGHTHGMQFGVEIGNLKWSPVQYRYPQWAGLYREGEQYLYVNRGYGYLGYPGRVGMPPEITIFELQAV